MSKLFIEALKKLPKSYVHDDTTFATMNTRVVAANPNQPVIYYHEGRWHKTDWTQPAGAAGEYKTDRFFTPGLPNFSPRQQPTNEGDMTDNKSSNTKREGEKLNPKSGEKKGQENGKETGKGFDNNR